MMLRILGLICALISSAARADFTDHVHPNEKPHEAVPLVYQDEQGLQHTLFDLRGRYVLLNVWATWCAPCVKEMPSLNDLQARYNPKKLTVLALSEDRSAPLITSFYNQRHITHLSLALDNSGVAPSNMKLRGLPTTLLIDPSGFEIARIEGDQDWTSADALAFLTSALK